MDTIAGRTALVTGASGGIGRAISLALAGLGLSMAITGRSKAKLESLKDELTALGSDVLLVQGDLANAGTPADIVHRVINHFGNLDILINNAGLAYLESIENTTVEQWDQLMNVNARAPFLLCKAALPYLKVSKSAFIINISSVVGRVGYVNQAAYAASKHALMGFTKVLAREVQEDGIAVHAMLPGGIATDMIYRMRPDLDKEGLMKPEEIADIIVFLLTHRGNAVIDQINVRRESSTPFQ